MARKDEFGGTWWAKRWTSALELLGWSSRLQRGRAYARQGNVLEVKVRPGRIDARVQGSRTRPYRVTVNIDPLSDSDWDEAASAMAEHASFAARLLAAGKLSVPSPPLKLFFDHGFFINDGRLRPFGFLGWPALMAPGVWLGIPGLMNAVYFAASVPPLFLSARTLLGSAWARLALLLWVSSPFLIALAATEAFFGSALEDDVVREAFALFLQHRQMAKVARELNERGLLPRGSSRPSRLGLRWTKDSIARVLRSPLYAGLMMYGDELHPGEHPPLIEESTYRAAQAILHRIVAAVGGRDVGFDVLGGQGRANEHEIVAEILAAQDPGRHRVEEGLGQFRLLVIE